MFWAVVRPKLYVHAWTGWAPAAEMADISCVTWVASVAAMVFRSVIWSGARPNAAKSVSGNFAKPC